MAMISLETLKAYLGISTGGDDAILEECIVEAQRQIENYTGRDFESSTGTKYFREDDIIVLPVGSQYRAAGSYAGTARFSWDAWPQATVGGGPYGRTVLWLKEDLLSVDSLTNGDGTVISSTAYWLEPRNSTTVYTHIRLKSAESWSFDTDGEIEIAGRWGYSTTAPDDIVTAMKRLAAYRYRQKDSSIFNVSATPELGTIQTKQGIPDDVKEILDNYVKDLGFA